MRKFFINKFLSSAWSDIEQGKNIELYLTMVIAVAAFFLDIFGTVIAKNQIDMQNYLTEAILISLTLLVYGLIEDRRKRETTQQQINDIPSMLEPIKENVDKIMTDIRKEFLKNRRDFGTTESLIRKPQKKLWISGILLDQMAGNAEVLEELLKTEGFEIRILAITPDEKLIKDTLNFLGEEDSSGTQRLNANLNRLHRMLVAEHKGRVEIRVMNQRPAVGFLIHDPDHKDGALTVEMYISEPGRTRRPVFSLTQKADKEWFNYFVSNYNKLWDKSEQWMPPQQ